MIDRPLGGKTFGGSQELWLDGGYLYLFSVKAGEVSSQAAVWAKGLIASFSCFLQFERRNGSACWLTPLGEP